MPFSLAIKPSVLKELAPIPKEARGRIAVAILDLSSDPRPPASRKLQGSENARRVRIGNYRVLYEADDDKRVVRIMAVGHRKDVYR